MRNKHLYVLLAAAVILKGANLILSQVIANDGPLYIAQAQLLLEGKWRQAFTMPINQVAFPGLIALMSFIVPDLELAGRMVSFLASIMVVIPLYRLIDEIFDGNSAFFGTAAFLLAPRINQYAVDIMRDSTFTLLFVLSLLYACRYINTEGKKNLFFFFLFSCLSIMFRLEGFLLLLIFPLFMLLTRIRLDGRGKLKIGKKHLLMVIPFVAVVALSCFYASDLVRILRIDDIYKRLLAPDGGVLAYANDVKAMARNLKAVNTLHSGWDNDFFEIVSKNIRAIYLLGLVRAIFHVIFWPFAVIALLTLVRHGKGDKERLLLVVALVAYVVFSYLYLVRMNFIAYRYLFPIAILMCPWVGLGLQKIFAGRTSSPVRGTALALFFGLLLVWPAYESFGHIEDQMYSGKAAGKWLVEEGAIKDGELMVCNDGTAPYYAGKDWDPSGKGWNSYLHLSEVKLSIINEEDWPKINELSISRHAKIIAVALHKRKTNLQPEFQDYVLMKSFEDRNYRYLIFGRPSS